MKPRRGLGKGLDALLAEDSDFPESAPAGFPAAAAESAAAAAEAGDGGAESRPRLVALSDLRPGAHQPRRNFDERELEELAESIRRRGILQPLLARPFSGTDGRGGDAGGGGRWEIVAGERRWRAAQRAGLREVPVLVREMSDREAMFSALVENLQRSDLNAMERARGILRLVKDLGMTHAAAGAEVGLSRPAVTNILRLLELSPAVQRMVESGDLDAGHARALAGLEAAAQLEAARRIAKGGLSAREAERLAARLGGGGKEGEKRRAGGAADADIRVLERELSSLLQSRAEIRHRKGGGGRLTIHYGSLDALDRVLARLRK